MGGRLTDEYMDILELWIGKGPKTFTLLYAITQDGCNATTFHQKCDYKGPTVTVLYNQQGSVYGGYASTNWDSSSSYVQTTDSFLFQLQYSNTKTANKFGSTQANAYSMYCATNYGPTFGSGHDLHTFTGTVGNSGGYFALNGYCTIGSSYDNRGVSTDKINNGTMNVTELEVYKLADGQRKPKVVKPWRKTKPWNGKFLNELMENVTAFKPRQDVKVKEARILMIGPVGAGKSSFYNTINSAFTGRITRRAWSGTTEQSLTTTYTPYTISIKSKATLNFKFCDTRGLEETTGISEVECNYLLDGNVPDFYQFNPVSSITPKTPRFIANPNPDDQIHCVIFVLDSSTLDVMSPKLVDKMKRFQAIMNQKGIPQLIVLTKIDKLCKDVEKDVSTVFKSETVKKHVDKAAQLLGLPPANVLPVKNYDDEIETEENVNILALLALRQVLNFTEDYFDNIFFKSRDVQRKEEKFQAEK